MIVRLTVALLGSILLAACSQSDPRSIQYFEQNHDEAREVIANCKADAKRGAECTNADIAVQTAEGREKFKRFRGK